MINYRSIIHGAYEPYAVNNKKAYFLYWKNRAEKEYFTDAQTFMDGCLDYVEGCKSSFKIAYDNKREALMRSMESAENGLLIPVDHHNYEDFAEYNKRQYNYYKQQLESLSVENIVLSEKGHPYLTMGELENLKRLIIETIGGKNPEYKYSNHQLKNICEILKKNGYITNADSFFKSLQGVQTKRKAWKKSKPMLIYFIERIREDGVCSYAKYSPLTGVNIASNDKSAGYKEIDQLIEEATLS